MQSMEREKNWPVLWEVILILPTVVGMIWVLVPWLLRLWKYIEFSFVYFPANKLILKHTGTFKFSDAGSKGLLQHRQREFVRAIHDFPKLKNIVMGCDIYYFLFEASNIIQDPARAQWTVSKFHRILAKLLLETHKHKFTVL